MFKFYDPLRIVGRRTRCVCGSPGVSCYIPPSLPLSLCLSPSTAVLVVLSKLSKLFLLSLVSSTTWPGSAFYGIIIIIVFAGAKRTTFFMTFYGDLWRKMRRRTEKHVI